MSIWEKVKQYMTTHAKTLLEFSKDLSGKLEHESKISSGAPLDPRDHLNIYFYQLEPKTRIYLNRLSERYRLLMSGQADYKTVALSAMLGTFVLTLCLINPVSIVLIFGLCTSLIAGSELYHGKYQSLLNDFQEKMGPLIEKELDGKYKALHFEKVASGKATGFLDYLNRFFYQLAPKTRIYLNRMTYLFVLLPAQKKPGMMLLNTLMAASLFFLFSFHLTGAMALTGSLFIGFIVGSELYHGKLKGLSRALNTFNTCLHSTLGWLGRVCGKDLAPPKPPEQAQALQQRNTEESESDEESDFEASDTDEEVHPPQGAASPSSGQDSPSNRRLR